MHRYEKLEKIYYKKRYIKLSIIMFILFSILFTSFYLFFSLRKDEIKSIKKPMKIEQVKKVIVKIEKKEPIKKKKEEIKEIQKLVLYPLFPEVPKKTSISKPKKIENKVVPIKKKEITKKEQKKPEMEKIEKKTDKKIKIIIKTSSKSLKELIKLYNQANEYNLAIQISNLYYEKQDYKNSIIWAKNANKLNPDNYESWYIFAKDLIKEKRFKEAKRVLEAYRDSYDTNKKINKLLRSIK